MVTLKMIDNFFAQHDLALVRPSKEGPKHGSDIYSELTSRDYKVSLVYPGASKNGSSSGEWEKLTDIPTKVGGAIITLPPQQAISSVQEAAEAQIPRVWLQLGSESKEAIEFCKEKGVEVIHGECIMMYAVPVKSIHGFHRWIWKVLGKLPQ